MNVVAIEVEQKDVDTVYNELKSVIEDNIKLYEIR